MDKPDEVLAFLKNSVSLFSNFPKAALQELVDGARIDTFEPNEAIIAFGEEGRFLGVLLEGEAEVSTTDDGGEKHTISALAPGDIFGEMSLMTGDKTMANVTCLSRCKVMLIPPILFSSKLITQPGAIKQISKTIADRLKAFAYDERGGVLAASALAESEDPYGLGLSSDEPMKLLVVNCGSSSLKYNLFDTDDESLNARGIVERIGEEQADHTCTSERGEIEEKIPGSSHTEAFAAMVKALTSSSVAVLGSPADVSAVGHRVVHGGDKFSNAAVISDEVQKDIRDLSSLAPLHNPVNLQGIEEAGKFFPDAPHVAVFDTSFHHTLPPYAYLYGLPYKYYEEHRVRRYGFHGMSHSYVALKAAEFLKRPYNELQIISCHLGNGASICAVDHGRSVDTSMGLTPTEGLIMGTRCGNVDPAALVHVMKLEGVGPEEMDRIINKESGVKGISGISNDMREVEEAAMEGHHHALLALKTYSYQIRKYIGSYLAAMGGLDALIFTGGIGQKSDLVRGLACQGLRCMGIILDEEKNRGLRATKQIYDISTDDSPLPILAIPTDEERMIARETLRALNRRKVTNIIRTQEQLPVSVEVSAHHLHLAQEHVDVLFGKGHQLTNEHELSQPGQYACGEKINLVGPKGRVERVRVLGPTRRKTQIEISMTEQFKLGIQPPIRASGDIEDSPGVTLEGPEGTVTLKEGVICALRHIHMTPEDALRFGIHDKDMVRVRVGTGRELIFGDVLIRVHPGFALAMHIDTDEANAANIGTGVVGYIDGIQSRN
ncbi:acetate/propionate family kinase [Verrucomicrobiota bacterium]